MQFLKNKTFRLLILLYGTMPLQGMLTTTNKMYKNLGKFKTMQQLFQQNKPQQIHIPINEPIKISEQTSNDQSNLLIKKPLASSSSIYTPIKTTSPFLGIQKRNYHTIPVQNNSSWNLFTALKNRFSNWYTNLMSPIQSTKIVYQLGTGKYMSSSLRANTQTFLENNNSNAIKNVFSKLIKDFSGIRFLETTCKKDPSLSIKILPLIQETLTDPLFIETLPAKDITKSEFFQLISTILVQTSHTTDSTQIHTINAIKEQLLPILIHHPFYTCCINTTVLGTILPNDIKSFITTINTFDMHSTDLKNQYKRSFIGSMSSLLTQKIVSEKNKEKREKLYVMIIEKEYALQTIEKIFTNNKDLIAEIVSALKNKLSTDNIYTSDFCLLLENVFDFLQYKSPLFAKDLTNSITAQFNKLSQTEQGIKLFKTTVGESVYRIKTLGLNNQAETASYRHLEKFASDVTKQFPIIFDNPNILSMIQATLQKENQLNDLGYEIFYHGRRWKYGLISDIYSKLFSYKSRKELDDFIFTHLDDPVLGKKNERFLASERAKREQLLTEGNIFSHDTKNNPLGISNRQALLFLNKFLFGNTNRRGSSSFDYVLNDTNVGEKEFSIQDILAMFGYSNMYHMYEKELQNLQKEYNILSIFGELLLIAVPKNKLNKCVYYTTSGGPKLSFNIPGVGTTTNTEKIVHYLDKNPEDICEFVLINTRDEDGGLNPDSGIKVFSFNTVDPDKMKAFKEKENALFARIIQSIEQEETIKQEKKVHQQARE